MSRGCDGSRTMRVSTLVYRRVAALADRWGCSQGDALAALMADLPDDEAETLVERVEALERVVRQLVDALAIGGGLRVGLGGARAKPSALKLPAVLAQLEGIFE